MPIIFADGTDLFVAYYFFDTATGVSSNEDYAVVRFSGVQQHIFGYPNEDVMDQHPLYSQGLEGCAFNEISNSPYVRELADRNSAIFPSSRSRYLEFKHWIIPFHDETLEVIGDTVEFLGAVRANSALSAITQLKEKPNV